MVAHLTKELEALALKVAKREFDRLYGPSENEPDKKAQIFLTEFASRFLDAVQARQAEMLKRWALGEENPK